MLLPCINYPCLDLNKLTEIQAEIFHKETITLLNFQNKLAITWNENKSIIRPLQLVEVLKDAKTTLKLNTSYGEKSTT